MKNNIVNLKNNYICEIKDNINTFNLYIEYFLLLIENIYIGIKNETYTSFLNEQTGINENIKNMYIEQYSQISFIWTKRIKKWSNHEVIILLQIIKLDEYKEQFKKNFIDGKKIYNLGKNKLKSIGVKKVGHRLRILKCINMLKIMEYRIIKMYENTTHNNKLIIESEFDNTLLNIYK